MEKNGGAEETMETDDLRRNFLRQGSAVVACVLGSIGAAACRPEKPLPALVLPDFSLRTPNGEIHTQAHYANQTLLLNFWATWCEPCRREMPALEGLHTTLRAKGLVVVGVSVDQDTNLVREFLMRQRVTFAVLLDPLQSLSKSGLNVTSFPTTLLVTRGGHVVDRIVGAQEWLETSIQQNVANRLGL